MHYRLGRRLIGCRSGERGRSPVDEDELQAISSVERVDLRRKNYVDRAAIRRNTAAAVPHDTLESLRLLRVEHHDARMFALFAERTTGGACRMTEAKEWLFRCSCQMAPAW